MTDHNRDAPALALVLHTHMPYVEGFGTWPFGEEWLWEAMATSYLPLLGALESVTLSLTPVLCDQLAVPGLAERLERFLTDVRRRTHAADADHLEGHGEHAAAREVRRAAGDYERALARLHELDGDLLGALAPDWTSAATHAVLPLLATDAGVRLQVRAGVDSHRARFGDGWRGGFWLPECAYAPWLDETLTAAGVRRCCVELPGERVPLRTPGGLVLVPIDRPTIDLVWGAAGYPSHPAYRDSHRRTPHDHQPWANDGAVYDPDRAAETVREHARHFVGCVCERGGLVVCALDTELLGHWWYEGVAWLEAVIEEAAHQRVGLVKLDDAVGPATDASAPISTWGEGGDLRTWDSPPVAELAWIARAAELRALADDGLSDAAARQLAALQSSDWAFQVSRELAVSYGWERARGHHAALQRAEAPRGLAPHVRAALLSG